MVQPAPIYVPGSLSPEQWTPTKHELIAEHVGAMARAGREHHRVAVNRVRLVGNALAGSPCKALRSGSRVADVDANFPAYPCLSILCDEPQFLESDRPHTLGNPVAIVEILSPSREAYNRGAGFAKFKFAILIS